MTELDILKWAAGSAVPTPRLRGVDIDRLLELLRRHRLEARFLQRIRRQPNNWVPEPLMSRLRHICENLDCDFRSRLQALLELHYEYVSNDRHMFPIKGDTSYLLTRNPANIRRSHDVDIIASHPDEFRLALQRLGFEDRHGRSIHNFAISKRDGVEVDGHKYFPVYGYPRVASDSELNAAANPGLWIQASEPQLTEITAPTLLDHSSTEAHPLAGPLRLPTVEMGLLVACANVFKDFLQFPPEREVTIRLSHLAEIQELFTHPRFDLAVFLQLVEDHNAHDAAEFVNRVCSEVFSHSPLPLTSDRGSSRQSPVFLFYYLAWLPAPWSVDDLLLCQDRRRPVEQLVEVLGTNILVANAPESRYSVGVPFSQSEGLKRVVVRGYDLSALRVGIAVQWTTQALILDLSVVGQIASHEVFIAYFGDTCLWIRSGAGLEPMKMGPNADFEFGLVEGGYELKVRLPWDASPYLDPSRPSVSMLLAVAKLDSGPNGERVFFKPRASAIIPIEVRRDG